MPREALPPALKRTFDAGEVAKERFRGLMGCYMVPEFRETFYKVSGVNFNQAPPATY